MISPVLQTFLTKFDVKKGNIVVWSQTSDPKLHDPNLAFKSMPSGIHEKTKDTICFTTETLHRGIAAFSQNSFDLLDQSKPIDRNEVKMFSLGVILDINVDDNTTEYYMSKLNAVLEHWLNNLQDMTILDQFHQDHQDKQTLPNCTVSSTFESNTMDWIEKLGPLLFVIWKATLLNERILILNLANEYVSKINSLCHMIKLMSPSLLNLFTIGISDLDSMRDLLTSNGYIACTNDTLLELKPEIYDKLIKVELGQISIIDNKGAPVKATPNELELLNNKNITNYTSLTEPISWTQFFWDELYLFTTAGYLKPSYHNTPIQEGTFPLTNVFESKTKTLHNTLETILLTKEFDELTDDTIYIHPSDLKSLQLDCFSSQDFDFVVKLSKKWFNKNVEVSGFSDYLSIAC